MIKNWFKLNNFKRSGQLFEKFKINLQNLVEQQ